jgi:hypothetical protein
MIEIGCFQILLFLHICLRYSVSDFWELSHLESSAPSGLVAGWEVHRMLLSTEFHALVQLFSSVQFSSVSPLQFSSSLTNNYKARET